MRQALVAPTTQRHEAFTHRALVRRRPLRAAAADASAPGDANAALFPRAAAPQSLGPSPPTPGDADADKTTSSSNSKTTPHFARLVEAPPSGAPGPAGQQPRSAAVPLPSVPPELEGLVLNESGDLVDAATGKPLPALGEPSRFDISCAALRGDFDPPPWRSNNERAPAPLVAALLGPFPLDYEFNAVGRPSPGQTPEAFANELAAIVHAAAACTGPVPTTTTAAGGQGGRAGGEAAAAATPPSSTPAPLVTFKERTLGSSSSGKKQGAPPPYVSVCVKARVRSAELLDEGFAALAADARVVMRF